MELVQSILAQRDMVLSFVKPESDEPSNKGMKQTKPGQLRSFAAYPRCSMDSLTGARNGLIGLALPILGDTWSGTPSVPPVPHPLL